MLLSVSTVYAVDRRLTENYLSRHGLTLIQMQIFLSELPVIQQIALSHRQK